MSSDVPIPIPNVSFDNLSVTEKIGMYLRNILRRIIRFPVFFITFLLFILLTLNLQVSPFSQDEDSQQSRILMSMGLEREVRDGLERCPNQRRPSSQSIRIRNDYWQYQETEASDEIIVYSAFFDDRPLLEYSTWIRILGVASLKSKHLFCHVWYEDYVTPFVTPAVLNVTGRQIGYKYRNATYVQYLFSCELPGVEPVPSHVSLATNQCESSTILLPVQRPVKAIPDQELGVCVPISFGSIPVEVFVEWIEMTRLLGVTEFNVYDGNMTGMEGVFEYYAAKGWLRVSPMPPAIDLFNQDGVKLSSAVSLNDCMMRNLYRYRLILVIDFDEIIIPRMHVDYHAMLKHILKGQKTTDLQRAYGFRNAFFFRELSSDKSQPSYLRTAVHRTRSELKKYGVNPKSFIDPRQCLSVFNHYCYLPLKADGKPPYADIHPSIAVTHHYRKCGFAKTKCLEYYNSSFVDDTALRFKDKLLPRVTFALKQLGIPTQKKQGK